MPPTPSSTEPEPQPTTAPQTEEPVASPTSEPTPVLVTEESLAAPTAEPTVTNEEEEPAAAPTTEPTMAPNTEEPTLYDNYTPTPVTAIDSVGEPSVALKTLTLAPATFAPSVAAAMPDGECNDPVAAFAQVGTRGFNWYSWCTLCGC